MAKVTEKRDRIVASALELFLRHGFEATTMDALAEHAEVTKPAVYYHFPEGKEGLFLELFHATWGAMVEEYIAGLAQMPDVPTMLAGLLESSGEIADAFGGRGGEGIDVGYMSLVIDGARRFPELRKELTRFYSDMQEAVVAKVEEAQSAGEVRGDVDPETFAVMLMGLFEGVLLVDSISGVGGFGGREARMLDVLWNGIAAQETEMVQE